MTLNIADIIKTRTEKLLDHNKADVVRVVRNRPGGGEGSDGDIAIGATTSGIKLFVKIAGRWHSFTPDSTNSFKNIIDDNKRKQYDISNLTIDRDYNANGGDIAIVSDVLGTLIKDLSDLGIIKLKK